MKNRVLSRVLKMTKSLTVFLTICIMLSNVFSQDGVNAPQPKPCKIWKHDYFTGVQGGYDWGAWYFNNFDECNYDDNNVLQCGWLTADAACKAWVRFKQQEHQNNMLPASERPFKAVPIIIPPNSSATIKPCHFRMKGKTRIDAATTDVSIEAPQMQDYCKADVKGPYSNCSDSYKGKNNQTYYYGNRGAKYSPKQKDLIRTLNKAKPENFNQLKSDLNENSIKGFTSTCMGGNLKSPQETGAGDPCLAVVHHLVPKIDINGCPCGKNSYKNAMQISNELNNWIKNSPARSQQIRDLLPLPFYTDKKTCKPKPMTLNILFPDYFDSDIVPEYMYGVYSDDEYLDTAG